MTRREALKVLDTIPTIGEQVDALEMAIKALEQQPCDDCISREGFIVKVKDIYYGYMLDDDGCCPQDFVDLAEEMPSVTPQPFTLEKAIDYLHEIGWMQEHDKEMAQPKVGEWLKNGELCKCSNCHHNVLFSVIKHYKYCPNCGCRMKGESE